MEASLTNGNNWSLTNYTTTLSSENLCVYGKIVSVRCTIYEVTKSADIDATYYVAESDALTKSPEKLKNYEDAKSGETYYKFGDYPQTIAESQADTYYTSSPIYNGWHLGQDGYFYEKCTTNLETYNTSNHTCSNGTELTDGTVYYFKVEPIKWRLLTDSYDIDGDNGDSTGLLLLAENILTANVSYYTSTYDNSELTRTLNGTTIYTNNYKYSNIRAYLNGTNNQFVTDGGTATDDDIDWTNRGFLQTAFTASAQDLISTTTVDNSAASTNLASNPTYYNGGINDYACGYTTDKIFLLSYKEATDHNTYGLGGQLSYGEGCPRIRKTTDYARANHALKSTDNNYGGNWWMRSPYYNNKNTVHYVGTSGNTAGTYNVSIAFAGIVPALCVKSLPE